jgi:hypothetical protein
VKLYRNGAEYPLTIEPLNNRKPVYEKSSSLFAQVGLATGVDGLLTNVNTEINCYPNPFSDDATIEIKLMKDSEVQVEVLNQLGQRVKFLQTGKMLNGGVHRLMWDGKNAGNREVAPGIHYLHIGIDDVVYYLKIILSK